MSASAYLDTVLVSALVRRDIDEIELDALTETLSRFDAGQLSLVCSQAVEDELARIPEDYRREHMQQLRAFERIPRVGSGGYSRLTTAGISGANPRRVTWERLKSLLPDESDAEHVFLAWVNRVKCVVTCDKKTMLKHKLKVRAICGVDLMLPSEFLYASSQGS